MVTAEICFSIQESFQKKHREKTSSDKTSLLMNSMNMDIWAVGTLNQLLL